MKVHVTGGSGFTGGFVIPRLVEAGHDVFALARTDRAAELVRRLGAMPVVGDLDDGVAGLTAAFAAGRPQALVNLASLGFGHAPAIVEAAEAAGIPRGLFVSTTAVLTALDAPAKAVRLAAEERVRAAGLAWTIVRPTMIYGTPGDRNMWQLLRLLRRTRVVPLPDGGHGLQQPVHVADLAAAIVGGIERDVAIGKAYDVPGPEALSLREVVEDAGRAVGRFPTLVSVPATPAQQGLRWLEGRGLHAPVSAEQLARVVEDKVFDGSGAAADLDHRPRPFWQGIAEEAEADRHLLGPGTVGRGARLARTLAELTPAQPLHRARLRGTRALLRRRPEQLRARWHRSGSHARWPDGFEPIDARWVDVSAPAEAMAAGTFRFLGEERPLGDPVDWAAADAAQLWRYHLHSFEWAWGLVRHADRAWARREFARLWSSWEAGTTFGAWDAWSPYVVSLRAWALCGVFEALVHGSDIEPRVIASLGDHAGYIDANLERDVGGNHLIKNLKALIGLGVFLDDRELFRTGERVLVPELGRQILPDGGHFERSPSYHCQVLADLLDLGRLTGRAEHAAIAGLDPAIDRMRRWLGAIVLPGGDVPLFNDCTLVGAGRVAALGPVPATERLIVLPHSGYVVARPADGAQLVVDVGPPCPPELPAHAHADCLSFELVIDGERAVVDAGTSTYASGPQRWYERSTAAHNTVEVDGTDQTEVWGRFRAGRRANGRLEAASDDGEVIEIAGWHDGYRHLPGAPIHRRRLVLDGTALRIDDEVSGGGVHLVTGRLRASERAAVEIEIDAPEGAVRTTVAARAAQDFGQLVPVHVDVLRMRARLPVRWATTIRWRATMAALESTGR